MATQFSNTLQMSNTTDALFRAWVQFIDDLLLVTGGWVNTADTGQMTISTATHPAGATTKVGYRVYRMSDALQSTAPFFMRIDFGSGTAAANPGIWITIGTGSNGAGTITGTLFNGGASANPNITPGTAAGSACNSYGSADTSRVSCMQFVRAGANDIMVWSVERTKDSATGNDTAGGFLLTYQDGLTGLGVTQFLKATPGSQPSAERPSAFLSINPAFGSDVGIGLLGHFNGILQPFGLGTIVVNSSDFAAESTITMAVYGTGHTFQLGNSATSQFFMQTGPSTATNRASTRVGIRYE